MHYWQVRSGRMRLIVEVAKAHRRRGEAWIDVPPRYQESLKRKEARRK